MYKHVYENLNEFESHKFFSHIVKRVNEAAGGIAGAEDKKDDKKGEKKEKKEPVDEKKAMAERIQKDAEDTIGYVERNWESFKRAAKDNVRAYASFWNAWEKCQTSLAKSLSKKGVELLRCYPLFGAVDSKGNASLNNEFIVASIREKGKNKLAIIMPKEGKVDIPSSKAADAFVRKMKDMKKEFIETKNTHIRNAALAKQKEEQEGRKEVISKLGQAARGGSSAPKEAKGASGKEGVKPANESGEGDDKKDEKKEKGAEKKTTPWDKE